MNWAWPTSLDQIWHSLAFPTWLTFPMWLTLVAAGLFVMITLIALVRAEKSVANGALTVITLLAIGVALASTIRDVGPATSEAAAGTTVAPSQSPPQLSTSASPALSCLDEMAGDTVLAACEKVLFGSAESTATAVSYTAARISRLTAFGDVATADRALTPDLQALRHSIERDRYGLAAYVLLTRDHCTPIDCAAFGSLTDHNQIVANMDQRVYDGLITRYAPTWNMPPVATTAALGPMASLGASVPTGKPTNAEFPSAASTPAVSIMNPEPGTSTATTSAAARAAAATASASNAPPPAPRPTPPPHAAAAAPTVAAAARKPAPKPRAPAAPVQIAPAAPAEPAPAAAASTE